MRLILVRHTSVSGTTGLCYGRTEVALADSFVGEAAVVRAALPPGPWSLHASPALRCRRLAETLGVAVAIDARLQEVHFGDWEGRAWDDLPRKAVDRWCDDFVATRPPHGETFAELAARAENFVADMARGAPAGTVVAVTHAGVIRALLAPRRGLAYADAFSIAVPPGSAHILDLPEGSSP
jgi:alpha-ribazole phosphatase